MKRGSDTKSEGGDPPAGRVHLLEGCWHFKETRQFRAAHLKGGVKGFTIASFLEQASLKGRWGQADAPLTGGWPDQAGQLPFSRRHFEGGWDPLRGAALSSHRLRCSSPSVWQEGPEAPGQSVTEESTFITCWKPGFSVWIQTHGLGSAACVAALDSLGRVFCVHSVPGFLV